MDFQLPELWELMPQLEPGVPARVKKARKGEEAWEVPGKDYPPSLPSEARIHQPSAGAQLEEW